jgi:hypothetical protein
MVDGDKVKIKPKGKKEVSQADVEVGIDFEVPLPEEFAHLVEGGSLIVLLEEGFRDMVETISGELIMSRHLPVDMQAVGIADPMTLWLLDKRGHEYVETPEGVSKGEQAILAARHVYAKQIQECNQEALILALTAHTEIIGQFDDRGGMIEPKIIGKGEKPFTEKKGGRIKSSFMRLIESREDDIPDVERNLKNVYEARMAWLEHTVSEAGIEYYNRFTREVNNAIVKVIEALPERDEHGFRPRATS